MRITTLILSIYCSISLVVFLHAQETIVQTNLGVVSDNTAVSIDTVFTNNTVESLELVSVSPSCECMKAQISESTIERGDSFRLSLIMDSGYRRGDRKVDTIIILKDNTNHKHLYRLQATFRVASLIEKSDDIVDFGRVNEKAVKGQTYEISFSPGEMNEWDDMFIVQYSESFPAQLRRISQGKFVLTVGLKVDRNFVGSLKGNIILGFKKKNKVVSFRDDIRCLTIVTNQHLPISTYLTNFGLLEGNEISTNRINLPLPREYRIIQANLGVQSPEFDTYVSDESTVGVIINPTFTTNNIIDNTLKLVIQDNSQRYNVNIDLLGLIRKQK